MLSKYQNHIVLAIFAFWILGFAFQLGRSTQHQEDRKQIEAAYKSSQTVQDQKHTHDAASRPDDPSNTQAEKRGGEAPEVTFIELKLGEGLLVFVTVWLVLVTRALVDGAKDTAERQLRAYISVEPGGNFRQSQKRKTVFEFTPNIVNNGLTPANDVIIHTNIGVVPPIIPPNFDYSSTLIGPNPSRATIGPRQSKFNGTFLFRNIDRKEMRLIVNKQKCFHLFGRVEYKDVFGHPHTSNFSFVIFVGRKSQQTVWRSTEHHNDCD